MARSPGACSTGCWRSRGFGSTAISGTSAGAMNAAVLADGWIEGGAEGARAALEAYLAARVAGRGIQSAAALAARPADGPLDTRHVARLSSPWI